MLSVSQKCGLCPRSSDILFYCWTNMWWRRRRRWRWWWCVHAQTTQILTEHIAGCKLRRPLWDKSSVTSDVMCEMVSGIWVTAFLERPSSSQAVRPTNGRMSAMWLRASRATFNHFSSPNFGGKTLISLSDTSRNVILCKWVSMQVSKH